MSKLAAPDLTFKKLPYGTDDVPWDMRALLYRGGAATERRIAVDRINAGALGAPIAARLNLVCAIHETLSAKLSRGVTPHTVIQLLRHTWSFVRWADCANADLTLNRSIETYKTWTEALLRQLQRGEISQLQVYKLARAIADILASIHGMQRGQRINGIFGLTRIQPPRRKGRALGSQADKENLERTFKFGHFLADLCAELNYKTLSGSLPMRLNLRDGRELVLAGRLKKPDPNELIGMPPEKQERAKRTRAPLSKNENVFDDLNRVTAVNLRIEAELLVFVSQTSMNFSQASKLERENYRWQKIDEDLQAFRVFKNRRGGEALFRCFKTYKTHLNDYLAWLDETGLSSDSTSLFPFIHAVPPAAHRLPSLHIVRRYSKSMGVTFIGPRQLRKTKVNWLLRRSGDVGQTAKQSAHSKEVLIRHYEVPHHQVAATEIIRFHAATDPSYRPPGPGLCTEKRRIPIPIDALVPDAPRPDCISPEGCLFCVHHRDVLSYDYCLKLASHAKIKTLELSLYKPSKLNRVHPACRTIDRINNKLDAIASGSDMRAQWVRDARDSVRAGTYHPVWAGHIALAEVIA